jgi:lysophospholipase L1-like esterase
MQVLVRQRVTTVIWVTMQEKRPLYRATNAAIRAAAKRWPQIQIADWNDVSSAKPKWFVDDGLHLSPAGAVGLAKFLRPVVLAWTCTGPCQRRIAQPSD